MANVQTRLLLGNSRTARKRMFARMMTTWTMMTLRLQTQVLWPLAAATHNFSHTDKHDAQEFNDNVSPGTLEKSFALVQAKRAHSVFMLLPCHVNCGNSCQSSFNHSFHCFHWQWNSCDCLSACGKAKWATSQWLWEWHLWCALCEKVDFWIAEAKKKTVNKVSLFATQTEFLGRPAFCQKPLSLCLVVQLWLSDDSHSIFKNQLPSLVVEVSKSAVVAWTAPFRHFAQKNCMENVKCLWFLQQELFERQMFVNFFQQTCLSNGEQNGLHKSSQMVTRPVHVAAQFHIFVQTVCEWTSSEWFTACWWRTFVRQPNQPGALHRPAFALITPAEQTETQFLEIESNS